MSLIYAPSKALARFTCMCRPTMKTPSTFIRNLTSQSQLPFTTITQILLHQIALSSPNSSLSRQRNKLQLQICKSLNELGLQHWRILKNHLQARVWELTSYLATMFGNDVLSPSFKNRFHLLLLNYVMPHVFSRQFPPF